MSTQLIHTISELRETLSRQRRQGKTIGLVPTMGALHDGHGKLIEQSAQQADCTVVSIFVNPIQFNDPLDYDKYPRTLQTDVDCCASRCAGIVFAPSDEEMYPEPLRASVVVSELTEHLCGRFRPGHFRGVATVVMKLLQIVQPDRVYFGEKDAQQLAVIRRMVRDLNVPVEIVEVSTVREADGLAMSSRNQRLTHAEREIAPVLYRALLAARRRVSGGVRDTGEVKRHAEAMLRRPELRIEYFEIVDPDTMQPVERINGPVRVVTAVWLGSTRLIDNLLCEPQRL